MRLAVVVGNPRPASRTLGVATAVAGALSAELGAGQSHLIVDLAEHAGDLYVTEPEFADPNPAPAPRPELAAP